MLKYKKIIIMLTVVILCNYSTITLSTVNDIMPQSSLHILTIEQEATKTDKKSSVLQNIAEEVSFPLSLADKEFIEQMKSKLFTLNGVGLAAPQVGIAKKIAVVYIPEQAALFREDNRTYPMHVIINPQYTPFAADDKKDYTDFEGCYSVATLAGKVPRFYKIDLTYQDETGTVINKTVDGFYARVLQHEIDHLNGVLITERLTSDTTQGTPAEMRKLRRQELPIDKQKLFDTIMDRKELSAKE